MSGVSQTQSEGLVSFPRWFWKWLNTKVTYKAGVDAEAVLTNPNLITARLRNYTVLVVVQQSMAGPYSVMTISEAGEGEGRGGNRGLRSTPNTHHSC